MKKIFFLLFLLLAVGIAVGAYVIKVNPRDGQKLIAKTQNVTHYSNSMANTNLIGARISGLICDLCVDGIESQLKTLSHVTNAKAFPKIGVVYLSVTKGTPEAKDVANVLIAQGYTVHELKLAQGDFSLAASHPDQFAKTLWAQGASEQAIFMSDPKNQQPTCEKKSSFDSYSKAW